jgi:ubiquinone biosynthesis protein
LAGLSRFILAGKSDLASSVTHIWRILCWGRILGSHGVLRGFETHSEAPPSVRRLARLARLFSFAPATPQYAKAFEKIGPAAIKLGQTLATRPDLIGIDAMHDLARLQDNLPPFAFVDVQKSIARELGDPDSYFIHVDPVAAGAASIAQVHKAVTKDGRTVAVKVLRPGIEELFADHISTYAWIATKLEQLGGEAARLRPRLVIETFRYWTMRELDLRLEAGNASELADRMADDASYHVPAIDWARTTKRLLTLEWIDGVRLTDKNALDSMGLDRKKLSRTIVLSFLRQTIEHGFFHADLHQGNLFVDHQGRLAVVDFGIMGRLDRLGRRYLAEILYGLLNRNYRRVAEIHFEAGYVPAHHNLGEFETALRAVGEPIRGLAVKDISPGRLLEQLFAVTRQFDMQTQPHLLLLQKSLVMVEGLAAHIDPDANMWEIAETYLRSWIRDELGPEARLAETIRRVAKDFLGLPDVLRRAADQVPRQGAAPPELPLPPLPEKRRIAWFWPVVAAFALGALLRPLF